MYGIRHMILYNPFHIKLINAVMTLKVYNVPYNFATHSWLYSLLYEPRLYFNFWVAFMQHTILHDSRRI